MMKRHDIEVPSLDYEKKYTKNGQRSPIYLAVAGKLFGMFLVSYRPDRRAAETLDSLAQSGISVLVQADDFNITAPLVAATYGIPEGTVKVLSQHEQDALETELAYRPESEGVMMHTGACASFLGGMPRGRARGRRRTPCGRCADGRCGAGCGAQCGVGLLRGSYGPFSGHGAGVSARMVRHHRIRSLCKKTVTNRRNVRFLKRDGRRLSKKAKR